ncbi:hypothetical protein GCM10022277_17060 [Litoribacillus peritrichatus]|uniref:Uncharacterized protein n=1 Tax=Litoribacillus peritrichatus TaxID=718191 RepID=A0ABP7MEV6_9GAMM
MAVIVLMMTRRIGVIKIKVLFDEILRGIIAFCVLNVSVERYGENKFWKLRLNTD